MLCTGCFAFISHNLIYFLLVFGFVYVFGLDITLIHQLTLILIWRFFNVPLPLLRHAQTPISELIRLRWVEAIGETIWIDEFKSKGYFEWWSWSVNDIKYTPKIFIFYNFNGLSHFMSRTMCKYVLYFTGLKFLLDCSMGGWFICIL